MFVERITITASALITFLSFMERRGFSRDDLINIYKSDCGDLFLTAYDEALEAVLTYTDDVTKIYVDKKENK